MLNAKTQRRKERKENYRWKVALATLEVSLLLVAAKR
jgi:hypothetical protein